MYDEAIATDELNRALSIISDWAYQWKIQFSPDKNKQAVQVKCFHRNLTGFRVQIEAFWEKKWALMDFQRALESYVKLRNCSSLAIY